MLRELIDKFLKKPKEDGFEYVEKIERDTVMIMVDGELVEVTADGTEIRK